ncbi:hypothetical protein [Sphingomicrobium arenosum]|uniref:hypothetical protein n=1 Tax=Sphingomicrobium arenosum TaxID=2233861 RepID=UPI00223FDDC3|nr:hypothetical protein [Sphingomicrobium arenosum]
MITMLTAAALAANPAPTYHQVDVDGDTITYEMRKDAKGRDEFVGRTRDGRLFRFLLRDNGVVTGRVGKQSVRFRVDLD